MNETGAPTARWSRRDFGALALVLLFAFFTRLPTINRTFDRDPEGCGSFYGQLARNYLRYDLAPNYFVPIQNIAITRGAPTYYPNHPPFVPLLIAGTYKLIGWDPTGGKVPPEWATRLPTALFTSGCSALIFVVLRNRDSLRSAIFGSIFFAITPMALTFGSQPEVVGSQLCFVIILTVVAYVRFAEETSVRRFALLCGSFALAAATDWPAFLIVAVMIAHLAFTAQRWRWIGALVTFAAICFIVLYVQIVAVTDDWFWMGRLVQRRALSGISDRPDEVISFSSWIGQALYRHGLLNLSLPIAALALAWMHLAFTRLKQSAMTAPVALLLAWAALHVIVGRQGVFVHEWWWWPIVPGAAMAAGVALDRTARSNVLAIAVIAFTVAISAYISFPRLANPTPITTGPLNYSLPEFGAAIRAAAPRNEVVLLAESDETLGLWYYADRPLRRNVWHPSHLDRAMNERFAELPFGWTEPASRAPVALIVPKAYVSPALDELIDYCRARYRENESAKFITFDLTSSPTTAPATSR